MLNQILYPAKIDLEKCCVSEVKKTNMLTTFPAQALPCSGSTGIISAGLPDGGQHPEELILLNITANICI